MDFSVFFFAFFLFAICLSTHILIWRISRPRRDALVLCAIFFLPVIISPFLFLSFLPAAPPSDIFAILLLHLAMSSAYIQIYPASQADSPSLRILIHVDRSMPGGMSEAQIKALFDDRSLLQSRVEDLLKAGLVSLQGQTIALTPQGKAFIYPFIQLRRMLGLEPGQG